MTPRFKLKGAGRIGFLDVEASGLGEDSFPIEVGWAILGGAVGSILIKPAPDWSQDEWDDVSADVHGIAWSELHQRGLTVETAARELNRVFADHMLVLVDAVDWDRFWVERLFDATLQVRKFELVGFWRTLSIIADRPGLLRARADAEASLPRHRAKDDAELLRHWWTLAIHSDP